MAEIITYNDIINEQQVLYESTIDNMYAAYVKECLRRHKKPESKREYINNLKLKGGLGLVGTGALLHKASKPMRTGTVEVYQGTSQKNWNGDGSFNSGIKNTGLRTDFGGKKNGTAAQYSKGDMYSDTSKNLVHFAKGKVGRGVALSYANMADNAQSVKDKYGKTPGLNITMIKNGGFDRGDIEFGIKQAADRLPGAKVKKNGKLVKAYIGYDKYKKYARKDEDELPLSNAYKYSANIDPEEIVGSNVSDERRRAYKEKQFDDYKKNNTLRYGAGVAAGVIGAGAAGYGAYRIGKSIYNNKLEKEYKKYRQHGGFLSFEAWKKKRKNHK